MNYQKEYAILVGHVDRAISVLEQFPEDDPLVRAAGQILLSALHEAEEQYMQTPEDEDDDT